MTRSKHCRRPRRPAQAYNDRKNFVRNCARAIVELGHKLRVVEGRGAKVTEQDIREVVTVAHRTADSVRRYFLVRDGLRRDIEARTGDPDRAPGLSEPEIAWLSRLDGDVEALLAEFDHVARSADVPPSAIVDAAGRFRRGLSRLLRNLPTDGDARESWWHENRAPLHRFVIGAGIICVDGLAWYAAPDSGVESSVWFGGKMFLEAGDALLNGHPAER